MAAASKRIYRVHRFWALLPLLTLLLLSFSWVHLRAAHEISNEASQLPGLDQNNLFAPKSNLSNEPASDVEAQREGMDNNASLFTPLSGAQAKAGGRCQMIEQTCNFGMVMGLGAAAGPKIGTLEHQLFLPFALRQAQGKMLLNCYQNETAQALGQLMQTDPNQERRALQCSPRLAAAAQARSANMARNNYVGHMDPKGRSPHYYIRQANYPLPPSYENDENYVESLAAGYTNAENAWAGLLASPHHRQHVLGEVDFFRQQSCFGTGYVQDDDHLLSYYVILSAPCPNDQEYAVEQAE